MSFGSSTKLSGFCLPFDAEASSLTASSILFAETGTITEPRIATVVLPQLNSMKAPVFPTGYRSRPISLLALVAPSFATPSVPSSDFVTISPAPAPALEHFSVARSHPVSVRATFPTVLSPV